MSDELFYLQLGLTSRTGTRLFPNTGQYQVAVEVPKDLVRRKWSECLDENLSEKAIALDLARSAALSTLATGGETPESSYHEDVIWCEDRPHVMNGRLCDHEENGVRVWRLAPERS
jgi:hypothetical protein